MRHLFSLYAPTTDAVACHCSAWDGQPKSMQRGTDGTWTCEADLPEGTHSYRYELTSRSWFFPGKQVMIADPMGRFLTSDHASTVIRIPAQQDAESYGWQHDHVEHPPHERLAIYECFIQDFTARGTLAAATERMQEIADLGFTAVEFLPLMGCDGAKCWGYTPSFFYAVEPRYGTEHDLCHLVDEVHRLGMIALFDGVYNHASRDCPLTHIDHDCYFHHAPKDPDHAWGPQFNYDLCLPNTSEFPARHFIKQKLAHWIRSFHMDGIRYDAVAQMREPHFLHELTDWTRSVAGTKPFFSIAECIPLIDGVVGPQGSMDACWQEQFSKSLRSILAGAWNGDALEACFDCRRDRFLSGRDVVNYLGTHDSGHTVRFLMDQGVSEADALHRMRLGFVVLFCAMGLPMVWMGDEFGALDPATQDPHPYDPRLLEDPRRQDLRALVKRLLQLRQACGALRSDHCEVLMRDDERQVLGIHRWEEQGGEVVILVHGSGSDVSLQVELPRGGLWEGLDGTQYAVDEARRTTLTVQAWSAQVLRYRDTAGT